MAKKKNIKTEKFSPYTFLVILSVLGSLIIATIIIAQFHEYIPQTNFFGESGLIKEPNEPIPYNEGDIFRPLFGLFLWTSSALIVVFIINIFKKNFAINVLKIIFGYPWQPYYSFWLFWLIGFPIFLNIFFIIIDGLRYLIVTNFEISGFIAYIISIAIVWIGIQIIVGIIAYLKKK